MSTVGETRSPRLRPLVMRGVPVHLVAPVASIALSFALLMLGGAASLLGGWLLTIAVPVAIGSFATDRRAMALPALLWGVWLAIGVAGDGAGWPQTPPLLAVMLAGAGACVVWFAQDAVRPALEPAQEPAPARPQPVDFDALFAVTPPAPVPADPSAEVDEALALLAEPLDAFDEDSDTPTADAPGDNDSDTGDDGGQVIEFSALSEEQLDTT